MKKYVNINNNEIITEDELNSYHERKYGKLSDKWQEEGFYNRDEYIEWLRKNDIESEFVEVQPYLIDTEIIGPDATMADVLKVVAWLKNQGISSEPSDTIGVQNEYSEKPSKAVWAEMQKEVFGHYR